MLVLDTSRCSHIQHVTIKADFLIMWCKALPKFRYLNSRKIVPWEHCASSSTWLHIMSLRWLNIKTGSIAFSVNTTWQIKQELVPLLPVMTGTLRGRERQSKMTGFWTQGMRKWVPSPTTMSCTPLNRSNITARCPASTTNKPTVSHFKHDYILAGRAPFSFRQRTAIRGQYMVRIMHW